MKLARRRVSDLDKDALRGPRRLAEGQDQERRRVIASASDGKVQIVVSVTSDLTARVKAGQIVKEIAPDRRRSRRRTPGLRRGRRQAAREDRRDARGQPGGPRQVTRVSLRSLPKARSDLRGETSRSDLEVRPQRSDLRGRAWPQSAPAPNLRLSAADKPTGCLPRRPMCKLLTLHDACSAVSVSHCACSGCRSRRMRRSTRGATPTAIWSCRTNGLATRRRCPRTPSRRRTASAPPGRRSPSGLGPTTT